MKSMFIRLPLVFLFCLTSVASFAQQDFKSSYEMGKDLYAKGKYTPAMEVFKPLTSDNPDNHYIQYAHYFYSLAALKANMLKDANTMLLQLTYKYPDWENIDEAYYLLANVAFEQNKPRPALNYLEDRKKEFKEDIAQMKKVYLDKLTIDTLINIQRDFPNDWVIANTLFKKLSTIPAPDEKQNMLIEYLAQEFKFEKRKAGSEKQSEIKTSYNIALLFPFMLKELNTSATTRPNQYVYDMYEGIRMAVDSLKREGVTVNIYAYDTEKNDSKVTEILSYPELKGMDVIVGPVFPANYAAVNEFGFKNKILVVNPISTNSNLLEGNPFVYLLHPTLRGIAGEAANYADSSFVKEDKIKNVIIFQSATPKDSALSAAFKDSITAKGFTIKYHEVIAKDNMRRIQDVLKDSIMLTTVSHIFVSSNDQVLAANLVSAMEISKFRIPIFAMGEWLQFPLLTYDQYERRAFHFIHPDFIDYDKSEVMKFRRSYYVRMGTIPLTSHAYQGFDMMRYWGKALKKYGSYPVAGIQKDGFAPGYVITGFDYKSSRSNGYVPVVTFKEANLTLVNYPGTR